MPAYLARSGLAVFALLFGSTLLTEHVAAARALVASATTTDLPQLREIVHLRLESGAAPVALAGLETAPAAVASLPDARVVVVAPAPATVVAAPPIQPVPPGVTAAVQADAIVLASWYGPGFYGNRTACGQTYTPEILGVAHLTLPCGTLLSLSFRGRTITVPVIDRGPYVAGRTLDLSNATKLALGCPDLCTLRMQISR